MEGISAISINLTDDDIGNVGDPALDFDDRITNSHWATHTGDGNSPGCIVDGIGVAQPAELMQCRLDSIRLYNQDIACVLK